MSKRLFTLTEMVKQELEQRPDTRSDDRLLIYTIYRDHYGIVNDKWMNVIFNRELPNFESIRRCRQKVQQECEELRGNKETQQMRLDAQKEYIEFALDEEVWERWI